jgi:hypothetical protein
MRQTSIDCYYEIRSNGLLSKRRMEVYEMIFLNGPLTANEIVRISKSEYPNTNPSSFHARLSELKRFGVILEVGEKKDEVSGNNCYMWDLTDRTPFKITTVTKKDRVNTALDSLRTLYKNRVTSTNQVRSFE